MTTWVMLRYREQEGNLPMFTGLARFPNFRFSHQRIHRSSPSSSTPTSLHPLSPPGPGEETENSNNYHTRHKTALYKSISLDSLRIRASVYCRWLNSTPPPLSNAT